jgi:hypothetical protein
MNVIKNLRKIEYYKYHWLQHMDQLQIQANIIRNLNKTSHCAGTRSKQDLNGQIRLLRVTYQRNCSKITFSKAFSRTRRKKTGR